MEGTLSLSPQDESRATYWPGRRPDVGEIDLSGSVYDAERFVRATTHPYPGAFFLRGEEKVVVWSCKVSQQRTEYSIVFKDGFLNMLDFEVSER